MKAPRNSDGTVRDCAHCVEQPATHRVHYQDRGVWVCARCAWHRVKWGTLPPAPQIVQRTNVPPVFRRTVLLQEERPGDAWQ